MSDWTTDANSAFNLRLVHANADKTEGEDDTGQTFHPTFTYPIFGDEEKIYGYQNLSINLHYASGSLAQYLCIKHSAKAPASNVDDVEGTLYKFIPSDYIKDEASFLERVEKDATAFRPMGEKVSSIVRRAPSAKGKGKPTDTVSEDDEEAVVYEAYHATWATPGFRDYHRKMQLFILLYIEGGSYLQEDEDKWEFMVFYEKRRRKDEARTETYHFVGYSSLYPFYCWPDKVRMRLSQFVIVPPYQQKGLGAELYRSIYHHVLSRDAIAELTIEDPSEAFEELRDKNDLRMLFSHQEFQHEALGGSAEKGKLGPPSDKLWVETWRRRLKLATRQFERLVEMLIVKNLDPADANAAREFRLQVKERLYRFNYELMVTLDKEEKLNKLEETFQNVKEDYHRILGLVTK